MRPTGRRQPTMFDIRFHVEECRVLKHSELFFPVRRTKPASLGFCPTATCSLINAFTIEQHHSEPKRLDDTGGLLIVLLISAFGHLLEFARFYRTVHFINEPISAPADQTGILTCLTRVLDSTDHLHSFLYLESTRNLRSISLFDVTELFRWT